MPKHIFLIPLLLSNKEITFLNSFYPKLLIFCSVMTLLCFKTKIHAQDRAVIDSIYSDMDESHDTNKIKLYLSLASAYSYHSQDTVCLFADTVFSIAEKYKSTRFYAMALDAKGFCHSGKSEYDSALFYYTIAKDIYEIRGDMDFVARSLNNISAPLYAQGKLKESLEFSLQSLRISENLGKRDIVLASNYWNMGNLVYEMDSVAESNLWYDKAIALYRELNKEDHVYSLLNLKAMNYKEMDSTHLAISMYEACEAYHRRKNQQTELAAVLENLGVLYMKREEWLKAEKYLLEALPIAESSKERRMAGFIYQRLGILYRNLNRVELSEFYGRKSLGNAQKLGLIDKEMSDHEQLASIYEQKRDYKNAYEHFSKFYLLKDSLYSVDTRSAMNELKLKYETEKKEKEIELLNEKTKRQKLQKNMMTGVIIGILGLFGALFYAMRLRMSKNKIEKDKVDQELDFSQKELEFNRRELDFKRQELTAYALQLAHKNEILEGIKSDVSSFKDYNERSLQRIINRIDFNQSDDKSWEGFRSRFAEVHKDFEVNIKQQFPSVSQNEMRLMALIRMSLSSKEIANILNVSSEGVKKARYRLRKKLELESNDSLEDFILKF